MLDEEYSRLEKLGFGQYGEVWCGKSLKNLPQALVAIKIFKRGCKDSIIMDELNMMNDLRDLNEERKGGHHPNLVNVVRTDLLCGNDTNLRRTAVMEYLGGQELFERILSRKSYSERDAAITIYALADALRTIHDKNLLHRDLKPENIVYRSEEHDSDPVIVDFGFGVHAVAIPGSGTGGSPDCLHRGHKNYAVGTPGYIAPESYESYVYMNKSDVWALGVITYIILVGFPPFNNKDKNLERRTCTGNFYPLSSPQWSHISDEAKSFVANMLRVDPNERPNATQLIEHSWIAKHTAHLRRKEMTGDGVKEEEDSSISVDERNNGFGEDYHSRIKALSSRRKLKKVVNGIIGTIRFKKMAVQHVLAKQEIVEQERQQSIKEEDMMEENASATGSPPKKADSPPIQSKGTKNDEGNINEFSGSPRQTLKKRMSSTGGLVTALSTGEGFSVSIDQLSQLHVKLVQEKPVITRTSSGLNGGLNSRNISTDTNRPPPQTASRSGSVNGTIQEEKDGKREESKGGDSRSASRSHSLSNSDGPGSIANREMSPPILEDFQTEGGLAFESFCTAVRSVGLHVLANRAMFDIFDTDDSNRVSPIEFIGTLAQFSDRTAEDSSVSKSERTKLYFSLFDLDGNGTISRAELHNVVGMLINEKYGSDDDVDADRTLNPSPSRQEIQDNGEQPDQLSNVMAQDVDYDGLFEAIDTDGSGGISFTEFSEWFNNVDRSYGDLFSHLIDPIDQVEKNLRVHFEE